MVDYIFPVSYFILLTDLCVQLPKTLGKKVGNGVLSCRPACNFIKKETLAQAFSCKFREIFKNNFFAGHGTTASKISS